MAKTYTRTPEYYSLDFKRIVVALTHHPEISVVKISKQLGLHPIMLYRWRLEMKNGDLKGKKDFIDSNSDLSAADAKKKIEALTKENKRLKEDLDLVKKLHRFLKEEK